MYNPAIHAITWLFFLSPVSHPSRFIFSMYSGDLENFQYVKSYLSHITRHILWFFNAGQSAISAVMLVRMYIKIVHMGCTLRKPKFFMAADIIRKFFFKILFFFASTNKTTIIFFWSLLFTTTGGEHRCHVIS